MAMWEIGKALQDRDSQYTAVRDDVSRAWRILDTYHPSLQTLTPEDEIPDDSPAVTVVTEGAFLTLVRSATQAGILENAAVANNQFSQTSNEELKQTMSEKDETIRKLQLDLEKSKMKKPMSESAELTKEAIDAIVRLTGMQDVKNA